MKAIREHGNETTGLFDMRANVRIREAMLEFVRESDWSLRSGRTPLRCVDDERAPGA
jgi:DNA-directed RNA polymerase specialized sigma subunit